MIIVKMKMINFFLFQSTPQCAIDSSPLDGSGCVDGGVESVEVVINTITNTINIVTNNVTNPIFKIKINISIQVCGTCAVVSDNSYPLGTTFML